MLELAKSTLEFEYLNCHQLHDSNKALVKSRTGKIELPVIGTRDIMIGTVTQMDGGRMM